MSWTNVINADQQGTQYQNSSGVWSGLDGSTAGFVLTSNGTGVAPSFQSASASSISITGDTGTITGGSLTIFANNATDNCGSSVLFTNLGTTSTLNVTDSNNNTIIGQFSGVLVNTASDCTGLGQGCLAAITDDISLVAVGTGSLVSANDSESNVAVGAFSLATVISGSGNTAVGDRSGYQLLGNFNTLYGYFSGQNYTGGESSNVLIQNSGVLGESNVLRIGTQGSSNLQVNSCFVAGITGATPTSANTPQVVLCDNAGNLTAISSGTTGQVLTSNGSATPSFQTLGAASIWLIESSAFAASPSNGYFITASCTGTLLNAPSLGSTVIFAVNATASVLTIQAQGSDKIQIGEAVSAGGGTAVSTENGDSVTLVYQNASATWVAVTGTIGTWTVT